MGARIRLELRARDSVDAAQRLNSGFRTHWI